MISADAEAIRNAALRLLDHRLRSVTELRSRLLAKGFAATEVDPVLDRLQDTGLLDDHAFAVAYVRDGLNLKRRGRLRLERELAERGVAEAIIQAVLDEECPAEAEADLAAELATKKVAQLAGLPPDAARRRLESYLLRRGIDSETVRRLSAELLAR